MRTLVLIRPSPDRDDAEGTLGRLVGEGVPDTPVMEPPWRDNRPCRSCIPPGAYIVAPHVSPRYGRCQLVTGTPGRSHILLHAGNVGGDVEDGWVTHTLGCLLPGSRAGRLVVAGRPQRAVLASRTATRRLLEWADGRHWRLEIRPCWT